MNLRQLEVFVAVAETRSFSRGAEMVSLNQSTISQHIASLENEIDMCLFDRTGKGAFLTSNGQIYLKHARRILAERDTLLESMAGLQALDNAHTGNDYTDFIKLIAEIVEDSFNPYWFALGLEAI